MIKRERLIKNSYAITVLLFVMFVLLRKEIIRNPGIMELPSIKEKRISARVYPDPDPAFNLSLNPKKKIIILLTSFRGGSTFLGQIFDSNPRLQYLFEPFFDEIIREMYTEGDILGARPDHTESELRMLYLQQIMHNCSVYFTNFAEKYELCGTAEENLARFNSTVCGDKSYKKGELYQEICKYRATTILKVIRMKNIEDLLKIEQIRSANVKIIHLIRHPVPLMMSRRSGGLFYMWDQKLMLESNYQHYPSWRVKVALEMYDYCSENIRNLAFAESNSWIKDRYMMVSHRDMSLKPQQTTEKIYDFVGEKLTSEIRDYITDITGASSEGFKKRSNNALEVYRNSTELSDKWKELGMFGKYWNLFSVELQCRKVYDLLGESSTVDNISRAKALQTQSDISDRNLYNHFNRI